MGIYGIEIYVWYGWRDIFWINWLVKLCIKEWVNVLLRNLSRVLFFYIFKGFSVLLFKFICIDCVKVGNVLKMLFNIVFLNKKLGIRFIFLYGCNRLFCGKIICVFLLYIIYEYCEGGFLFIKEVWK